MSDCKHAFTYIGLQYQDGHWTLPGSGAMKTYYAHAFHCTKCCAWKHDPANIQANSYESRLIGSSPAPAGVDLRPATDR